MHKIPIEHNSLAPMESLRRLSVELVGLSSLMCLLSNCTDRQSSMFTTLRDRWPNLSRSLKRSSSKRESNSPTQKFRSLSKRAGNAIHVPRFLKLKSPRKSTRGPKNTKSPPRLTSPATLKSRSVAFSSL